MKQFYIQILTQCGKLSDSTCSEDSFRNFFGNVTFACYKFINVHMHVHIKFFKLANMYVLLQISKESYKIEQILSTIFINNEERETLFADIFTFSYDIQKQIGGAKFTFVSCWTRCVFDLKGVGYKWSISCLKQYLSCFIYQHKRLSSN